MKYYYLTMRPLSPSTVPTKGLVSVYENQERTYIPAIQHEAYAKLAYNRELTTEELRGYELIPEAYEVQLSRSDLRLLSDMLKECARIHTDKGDDLYEIYLKLQNVLEG